MEAQRSVPGGDEGKRTYAVCLARSLFHQQIFSASGELSKRSRRSSVLSCAGARTWVRPVCLSGRGTVSPCSILEGDICFPRQRPLILPPRAEMLQTNDNIWLPCFLSLNRFLHVRVMQAPCAPPRVKTCCILAALCNCGGVERKPF